jgi:nucleoside 2-deoxyribosyltransferase
MSEEKAKAQRFLNVFVVRSLRESHLDDVMTILTNVVSDYESKHWKASGTEQVKPYRVVNTNETIKSGEYLLGEITQHISNAALTIVILDGFRRNILFELGYLIGRDKPFILLRHRRWGPPYSEILSGASDISGVFIKDYDHETKDGEEFKRLLRTELEECEDRFVNRLQSHSVIPQDGENLVTKDWEPKPDGLGQEKGDNGFILRSFKNVDLEVNLHTSKTSQFVVRFKLRNAKASITAYLRVRIRTGGQEKSVWFGYSSETSTGQHDYREEELPEEITVPISVSGPSEYVLTDNIHEMVSKRLGRTMPEELFVDRLRLRGGKKDGSETLISEVRITN